MNWNNEIKIKHLLTEKEDLKSIQASMNNIADVIHSNSAFNSFNTSLFRNIPVGDEFFKPVDYANELMDRMYDFADENRIWIK